MTDRTKARLRGRASTRRWRLGLAMVAAVLALAVPAAPASAHNALISSTPADKATVAQTPSTIVLTFDEPAIAMGTAIVVTGPNGAVQVGAPVLVDNTVSQALASGAPAGAYAVDWRVTSADGHPATGRFTFTARAAGQAGPASATAKPTGQPTGPTGSTGSTGSRQALLAPAFVLVLAAIVLVAVRRRRERSGTASPRSGSDS